MPQSADSFALRLAIHCLQFAENLTCTFKMGKVSFFSDTWTEKYPFIKEGSDRSTAFCLKCNCEISVSNLGITAVHRHVETEKHKTKSLASIMSAKLTDHFRKRVMGKGEKELAAAEGLFAYHTVKNNQSFR